MMNENTENTEWTKRNVVEEPRLSELKELYEELGFEVRLEDCTEGDFQEDGCNECIKGFAGRYKVIYTKPK
ncbi:MAG: hypothetical protein EPN82_12175 [Bacteroidetes bacterium]|nr:MAG: hypothetical protein EPN82_12175 [Bacteroidota bacterium]